MRGCLKATKSSVAAYTYLCWSSEYKPIGNSKLCSSPSSSPGSSNQCSCDLVSIDIASSVLEHIVWAVLMMLFASMSAKANDFKISTLSYNGYWSKSLKKWIDKSSLYIGLPIWNVTILENI